MKVVQKVHRTVESWAEKKVYLTVEKLVGILVGQKVEQWVVHLGSR
jgi:hypothetical protein